MTAGGKSMPAPLRPSPLEMDHDWSAAELVTWRDAVAENLSYLDHFAGRGAARRRGVHELRARSATEVTARVQGSARSPYTVRLLLEMDEDCLEGTCTCPYSGGEGDCKHVWAVLDRLDVALAAAVAGGPAAPVTKASSPRPSTRATTCGLADVSGLFDATVSDAHVPVLSHSSAGRTCTTCEGEHRSSTSTKTFVNEQRAVSGLCPKRAGAAAKGWRPKSPGQAAARW